jgi:hypothetical protein
LLLLLHAAVACCCCMLLLHVAVAAAAVIAVAVAVAVAVYTTAETVQFICVFECVDVPAFVNVLVIIEVWRSVVAR